MHSNPLCLDIKTSSKMGRYVIEHAIKVRKPYTISKQQERWTEEHSKFLEALKLYGRAWRKMQGEIPNEVEAIDIPPPMPKKKPMHPYPRKLGNLPAVPVKEKLEWLLYPKLLVSKQEDNPFIPPKLLVSEQDNSSPTSVLSSAVGSDTFGSTGSNFMNSSVSPASSAVGSEDPVGISMSEQVNGCQLEEVESLLQQKSPHKTDIEVEDMGTDGSIALVMVPDPENPGSSMQEQDSPKQEVDQSAVDGNSGNWGSWPK